MTDARRGARWLGGLAVTGAAVAIFIVVVKVFDPDEPPPRRPAQSAQAARPARPPGPNDPKPAPPPMPSMPVITPEWRAQLAEQVRGKERPGTAAFRAVSERYVDENLDLAKQQAAAEGLTLPELRELTHFGLLVLATQRTDDVEQVIGRELSTEERDSLSRLMQSSNGEFREAMRALVARGGSEEDRWKLIRDTQSRYQSELFRITGLDEGTLDDLLAGNLALPGAPARGDAAEGAPAGGPRDQVGTPPRPRGP